MNKFILIVAVSLMISCTNPSSNIKPGIVVDESIGLIAGMNLDDNLLLCNDGVYSSGTFSFTDYGISNQAFKSIIDEENIGGFIEIEDSVLPNLYKQGSISVWVKSYEYSDNSGIIHKGVLADYSDESLSLQMYGGKILFYARRDLDGLYEGAWIQSDIELIDNEWYFLTITWKFNEKDGSMMFKLHILYENNKVEIAFRDTGLDGGLFMSERPVLIGAMIESAYVKRKKDGNYPFNGLIDEVHIYDVVRTAREIQNDYNLYK